MSVDAVFDKALADIFSIRGTAAIFTPAEGDPLSCRVLIERDTDLQPGGYEAQAWGRGTTLEYRLDEVGKEADRGETFTVGSDVWTVRKVEENDGLTVKVVVK